MIISKSEAFKICNSSNGFTPDEQFYLFILKAFVNNDLNITKNDNIQLDDEFVDKLREHFTTNHYSKAANLVMKFILTELDLITAEEQKKDFSSVELTAFMKRNIKIIENIAANFIETRMKNQVKSKRKK